MFGLIAKHNSSDANNNNDDNTEEETKQPIATDSRRHSMKRREDAASSSSSSSLAPPSLSTNTADSYDLSSSPLGLMSSLSSSLLSSAKEAVKRGMEQGVEGIERATRKGRNSREENDVGVEEGDEQEDNDEFESKTPSSSHRRRVSWSRMKHDEPMQEEESDSKVNNSASASSSTGISDISVLRMNFLRLLHRCEEISFTHLHPDPGTIPLLHRTTSDHACYDNDSLRQSKSFFKSVACLQTEYLPEFRRRRILIQPGKENSTFMKRVGFLATLAEKEAHTQNQHRRKRQIGNGSNNSISLARGIDSLRSVAASIVAANAAAVAASSSATSSPASQSDSLDSLSLPPPAAASSSSTSSSAFSSAERLDEIRSRLFAKQQQQSERNAQRQADLMASRTASTMASQEFSAEMEQRQVIEELHEMTDSLKTNALRMRTALAQDSKILHSVDDQLVTNLDSIKHENSRLKSWASRGCSEMCWNILLIIVLWTVFVGMFIFMKIFKK